jgi:hypothetical protein
MLLLAPPQVKAKLCNPAIVILAAQGLLDRSSYRLPIEASAGSTMDSRFRGHDAGAATVVALSSKSHRYVPQVLDLNGGVGAVGECASRDRTFFPLLVTIQVGRDHGP